VFPVVFEIVPVPELLLYVIVCEAAVHTAYNVVPDEIEKVDEVAREVPETLAHVAPAAGCAVHHPLNVYPVFASVPVLLATVTVWPLVYAVPSVGTEPEVLEFPL
jgi:hypothetical protein